MRARFSGKRPWGWLVLVLTVVSLLLSGAAARADSWRTVNLPITLDYPWLRSMLIFQMFNSPGQRSLLTGAEGCSKIELSEPRIYQADQKLGLEVRIKVEAGVRLFGKCVQPVEWEGYLRVNQHIWVDPDAWRVRVKTLSSQVFDRDKEPAVVADVIWKLIRGEVYKHLDKFSVNLKPPLERTREQIPMFFPAQRQAEVERWLASLRLGGLTLDARAVRVALLMEVALPAVAPETAPPVPDEEARAKLLEYWRSWDALLVHKILGLSGQPLSQADRDELLLLLLETRYGLLQALKQNTLRRDLVREQFVAVWQRLAPILRRHLEDEPSPSLLHYLSYFSAADALTALDQVGPLLGLDISREGLLRLAWLVDQGKAPNPLAYNWEVNPGLRRLLNLGGQPSQSEDAQPIKLKKWQGVGSWLDWLVSPAWAEDWREQPPRDQLAKWLPPKGNQDEYKQRLRQVVENSRQRSLAKGKLPEQYHSMLKVLIPATIWQESCWRQFLLKGDQVEPLRSYNNSSVGIMQINDMVWRGIYDRRGLNWDLAYNAAAGCEILENYLRRYALERYKTAGQIDQDTLAQATYAMYNGGPRQFMAFLKRSRTGRLYRSDRLFLSKYQKVKKGESDGLSECLRSGS